MIFRFRTLNIPDGISERTSFTWDHGFPSSRTVPDSTSVAFVPPIPLRDSPGISPGSLLTHPLHVVGEPERAHKIYQLF